LEGRLELVVLGDDGKHAVGLNHPRARNLALVADPDAWFTCYWPTTGSKTGIRRTSPRP